MTDKALTELNRKIAVMQAYRDGKEIQYRRYDYQLDWRDSDGPSPFWNWAEFDYRVKPTEPQRLVGLKYHGEQVRSAWHSAHWAGVEFSGAPETAEKVEFIELTPEIKQKPGL